MYPFLTVFGIDIPMYGLMSTVGIGVSCLYAVLANRSGKAGRLQGDDLLHIILLAVIGALIGAKVLGFLTNLPVVLPVIIEHWDIAVAEPMATLTALAGGLVFYGGAIGGMLAVIWYCRKYKVPMKIVFGMLTPIIPLFHTFGRIGCFFGGCCWGIEVPWGIAFTHSIGAPNGVPLLPVQLIEAACNFVLFVVLAVLSHRLRRRWLVLPIYVGAYAVIRFVLEFFRGDKVRGVFLLSSSQWISLALLVGLAVMWFTRWRHQTDVEPLPPTGPQAPNAADAPPPAQQGPALHQGGNAE